MDKVKERTLQETPTWVVAVVCFVLLAISIIIEHIIEAIGKWLKKKQKNELFEALEKVKGELMLMGFISLLLTGFQSPISSICISKDVASTWLPCPHHKKPKGESETNARKVLEFLEPMSRRVLATKGYDDCGKKDKVALVSAYGIHQLHIFIFVLAIFHFLQCVLTLTFARSKMAIWRAWEDQTKTIENQFSYNDPRKFRFARETTFVRRHLNTWNRSPISLWIVSFFRQFYGPVDKADYLALRHGFIMAHMAPGSEATFDFQKYIDRSLEKDFKVVVGISPSIWFFAVLMLLTNTHGWYSYFWLPFIPLIIILLVGTKLQMIITKMGLNILDRGEVVTGAPVVEPGDHLFWFNNPHLLLSLIHFVLFQNAFQLAFFAWSTYDEFTINSCFNKTTEVKVIRITMGVVVQVLCSYITLPLYALVTQMGSNMKPAIFNDNVATAVKKWYHSARDHVKHRKEYNESDTPFSSRPATPTHGMSPVHLLHKHTGCSSDDNEVQWGHVEGSGSSSFQRNNAGNDNDHKSTLQMQVVEPSSIELPPIRAQHEITIVNSSGFSFGKLDAGRN